MSCRPLCSSSPWCSPCVYLKASSNGGVHQRRRRLLHHQPSEKRHKAEEEELNCKIWSVFVQWSSSCLVGFVTSFCTSQQQEVCGTLDTRRVALCTAARHAIHRPVRTSVWDVQGQSARYVVAKTWSSLSEIRNTSGPMQRRVYTLITNLEFHFLLWRLLSVPWIMWRSTV